MKYNKRWHYGPAFMLVVIVVWVVVMVTSYVINRYGSIDSDGFKMGSNRYGAADRIICQKCYIGKTASDVKAALGPPDREPTKEIIGYILGTEGSFIGIDNEILAFDIRDGMVIRQRIYSD